MDPAIPPVVRLRWPQPAGLEGRLSAAEREVLASWPAEKRRRDWLLGRAAAKQAVREAQERGGAPPADWTEVEILASPHGAPRVHLPTPGQPLAVSLSHGHGRAAAWACPAGAEGGLPGVDLELVRPRRLGTLRFYLHEPERAWVLALPGAETDPPPPDAEPTPRDLGAILLWALKEAAFKALQPPRGTGLLDVSVELDAPYDAVEGRARVTYGGKAEPRAAALGVSGVEAGWLREGELVLAWVLARGARLPED